MVEIILKSVACHLLGDYVLQSDYLAKEKGRDWYILFVHCFLYCVPFAVVFGIDWRLVFMFCSHFIIDAAKARYKWISIGYDQFLHYFVAATIYIRTFLIG